MDRIVFYNGEETGYVVERTNFNNSFFAEQYASALKLFKKIYCSTGPVSNIIAFVVIEVKVKLRVCVVL